MVAFVGRGRGLLSRSIDLLRHRNLAAAEVDRAGHVGVTGTIDQWRHFVKYDLNISETEENYILTRSRSICGRIDA